MTSIYAYGIIQLQSWKERDTMMNYFDTFETLTCEELTDLMYDLYADDMAEEAMAMAAIEKGWDVG